MATKLKQATVTRGMIVLITPALTIRFATVDRQANRLFDRLERAFHVLSGQPPQRVRRRSPLWHLIPKMKGLAQLVPARGKPPVLGIYTSSRPEPMPRPGARSENPSGAVIMAWATHIEDRRATGGRNLNRGLDSLILVSRVALGGAIALIATVLLSFGPDALERIKGLWGGG